jgi:hypothetical protein
LVESIFGLDTATVQINVFPVNQGGGTVDNPNDASAGPTLEDPIGAPPVNEPKQEDVPSQQAGDSPERIVHSTYSSQLDFAAVDSKPTALLAGNISERVSRYDSAARASRAVFETGTFDVARGALDTDFNMSTYSGSLDEFHDSFLSTVTIGNWRGTGGIAFAGSLSIGWVIFSLKGGYIVGSLLSATTPTWAMIDPLPVFDSLESNERDKNGERDLLDELLGSTASRD